MTCIPGTVALIVLGQYKNNDVVLKEIPNPHIRLRDKELTAFHNEIEMLSGSSHNNVVQMVSYSTIYNDVDG